MRELAASSLTAEALSASVYRFPDSEMITDPALLVLFQMQEYALNNVSSSGG
jgi:hypothetical protein